MTRERAYSVPILYALCWIALLSPATAAPLDPQDRPASLSVVFGGTSFSNDDLRETYGAVPAIGIRIAKQADERAEFFVVAQYGGATGDPYYATPDFRTGRKTRLQMVPIDLGVRLNATSRSDLLFFFGLAVRRLWLAETSPDRLEEDRLEELRSTGWGWGLRGSIGPEWRDRSRRLAIGLEISTGPQDMVIGGHGTRTHDLTGFELRGHVSALLR